MSAPTLNAGELCEMLAQVPPETRVLVTLAGETEPRRISCAVVNTSPTAPLVVLAVVRAPS